MRTQCRQLRAASLLAMVVPLAAAIGARQAGAQTVGPSPPTITTTVTVNSGLTTVVGSTIISTAGATPATNVTGGMLVFDATAGPSPGSITVQSVNGNALQANGGTILVPFPGLSIQTAGGHAVLANGSASTVTFSNGAAITTTGVGAALAAIGGTINATGVVINNTGTSSAGHGAIAESGGTINLHAGTSITTTAFNSVGLGASGANSQVIADALIPVTMNGRGALGVYLHDGGQVSVLPGTVLQLNGTSSVGITADNTTVAPGTFNNITVNLNGAGVPSQAGSTGVVAVNGGNITLNNLTVQGTNAAAGAWARPGSSITITGQSVIHINAAQNPTTYTLATPTLVTTSGPVGSIFSVTSSIPLAGLKSDAGLITSVGTTINVTSDNGAAGANTAFGGVIDMTDNTIVTTGANSFGIRVDSGQVIGRDSRVTTSGGGAALFFNFGPGLIDLTNTTVLATGPNTTGLASLNGTPSSMNTFRMSGGSLISTEQAAIIAQGPLNVTTTNGAVVTGDQFLLAALNQSSFFPQPTVVDWTASGGSVLTGDATAEPLAIANLNLMTGSHWTGAAIPVTNVTVDPTSIWTVTASSVLTQQLTNAGLVEFTPPSSGGFKTLTAMNYLGTGGTLGLNTFLGSDASPSDKLIINGGTATGTSALRITNAGGLGDLTVANGILVVDAINGGTTVPGTFALSGPVLAGPYEYLLFRGSRDTTAPQSWFLRSALDCSLPGAPSPPCPTPPGPVPTPPAPVPNFRQEVSLYAAVPAMALLYGRTLLDTLHERVGEQEHLRGRRDLGASATNNGQWGRVVVLHGNRDGDPVGIYGNGPKYDYDFAAFQVGQDVYRAEQSNGARNHIGVYVALGDGRGDVSHFDRTAAGSDSFTAYTIGGYWTHFGPTGWYLDSVLQGTWYDIKATSTRLPALDTEGGGLAASLESGYPIKLGGGWIIEPQAQVVYQLIGLADGEDLAATVKFHDIDTLAGRIGARLANTWRADGTLITAWVRPNLWHEFRGEPKTAFSSETGFIPFRADLGGSWAELNTGVSAQLDRTTSVYANGSYQWGLDGRSDAWDAKLGFRVNW